MDRRINITGRRYGKLVAVKMTEKKTPKKNGAIWLWKCDCGNEVVLPLHNVANNKKLKSCGCVRKEQYSKINKFLGVHNIDGTCIERIKSSKPNKNGSSGVKGVCWNGSREQWQARLYFKGKNYFLGRFNTKEEATRARKKAERKLYKPFLESLHGDK